MLGTAADAWPKVSFDTIFSVISHEEQRAFTGRMGRRRTVHIAHFCWDGHNAYCDADEYDEAAHMVGCVG